MTDKQETTCFVSGLKESLWADVRAQHPKNLSSAISLARIYEGKNLEVKRSFGEAKSSPFQKKGPISGLKVAEEGRPDFLVRRFTPAELQKRREQGLCVHCDERYTFNHECKKLFWIEMEDGDEQASMEETEEEEPNEDKLEIYLNTLVGMSTPKTM